MVDHTQLTLIDHLPLISLGLILAFVLAIAAVLAHSRFKHTKMKEHYETMIKMESQKRDTRLKQVETRKASIKTMVESQNQHMAAGAVGTLGVIDHNEARPILSDSKTSDTTQPTLLEPQIKDSVDEPSVEENKMSNDHDRRSKNEENDDDM